MKVSGRTARFVGRDLRRSKWDARDGLNLRPGTRDGFAKKKKNCEVLSVPTHSQKKIILLADKTSVAKLAARRQRVVETTVWRNFRITWQCVRLGLGTPKQSIILGFVIIIRMISSRRVRRVLEMRNAYEILVAKSEGKRPLGRPGSRWENIKMELRETGLEVMNWVQLA